jgi:hypothetical protein
MLSLLTGGKTSSIDGCAWSGASQFLAIDIAAAAEPSATTTRTTLSIRGTRSTIGTIAEQDHPAAASGGSGGDG